MSVRYVPVQWTRSKIVYDLVLAAAVLVYLWVFLRLAPAFADQARPIDGAILRMRAFGTCAFLMLTVILAIGPLARIDRRFLPLLYNRRHFGVATAGIASVHASHVIGWYFAFSPTEPMRALLSANTSYGQILGFPFEVFGILALAILLVLAATSHDFWLSFLTPPLWKAIHMGVYLAYGSLVLHIALGTLQSGAPTLLAGVVAASLVALCGLHLAAGRAERARDSAGAPADASGWLVAGRLADLADGRGLVLAPDGGERIAVFRDGARIAALSNLCAHQNGPLGEGRVIDGCVTCPWHGFQYRLEDGCAPAPFTEKVATYKVRLEGGFILIDPRPAPLGQPAAPALIPEA